MYILIHKKEKRGLLHKKTNSHEKEEEHNTKKEREFGPNAPKNFCAQKNNRQKKNKTKRIAKTGTTKIDEK